ncbi:MAG: hypothetical protein WB762_10145 [Candidatus Sulfotelmatobacter sp.]
MLPDRVEDRKSYPFSVLAIAVLDEITLQSRACFFAGENGTGKSALLQAIAARGGFVADRNVRKDTTGAITLSIRLVRSLRLSCDGRTGAG